MLRWIQIKTFNDGFHGLLGGEAFLGVQLRAEPDLGVDDVVRGSGQLPQHVLGRFLLASSGSA